MQVHTVVCNNTAVQVAALPPGLWVEAPAPGQHHQAHPWADSHGATPPVQLLSVRSRPVSQRPRQVRRRAAACNCAQHALSQMRDLVAAESSCQHWHRVLSREFCTCWQSTISCNKATKRT